MNGDHIPFDQEKEIPTKTKGTYRDHHCGRFNNFYLHFPFGKAGEVDSPDGYNREIARKCPYWDNKPDDNEVQKRLKHNTYNESRKHLSQSGKEFYDDIDAVLVELNIPMSSISEALYKTQILRSEDDADWQRMYDLLSAVYAALRKRGYNKQDLCG
mgnify:CR=1 FL=1